jgi:hypothetical protein
VVEGSRIAPELAANVAAVWATADINDDTQDDEANDCGNLDNGKDEFGFTVSFDAVKRQ